MENHYHIAELTENAKEKLKHVEDELGVILIAWEEEKNKHNNQT